MTVAEYRQNAYVRVLQYEQKHLHPRLAAMIDADWQLSRRMTATQYRAALKKLNLSMSAAARLMDVSPRTSARYASGEAEVPELVALFLGLIIHFNVEPVVPKWRKPRREVGDIPL